MPHGGNGGAVDVIGDRRGSDGGWRQPFFVMRDRHESFPAKKGLNKPAVLILSSPHP